MLRGVAESKRKKEGKGHANGPSLELGLGRFGSGWERVYKGVETLFFPFSPCFSLSSLLKLSVLSLLSLLSLVFSDEKDGGRRWSESSDAVDGESSRRRHRVGAKTSSFFLSFYSFPMYFNLRIPFLNSKFQKKLTHGLRSKV